MRPSRCFTNHIAVLSSMFIQVKTPFSVCLGIAPAGLIGARGESGLGDYPRKPIGISYMADGEHAFGT